MSLEQLECRPMLGPEADIYSFGVVLYEMLTGRMPFEAETLGAMLLRQLKHRPLPPSHFVPSLSPALDRFVTRCLRSDSKDRYPDAGSAMAALDAIAGWERPRKWRVRPWQLLAGAVVCSALLLGGAGVFRGADSPVDVRQRIEMSTTLAEANAPSPRELAGGEDVAPPHALQAKPAALEAVDPEPKEAVPVARQSASTAEAKLDDVQARGLKDVQVQRAASAAPRVDDAPARRAGAEVTAPAESTASGQLDWTPRAVPKALLLPPTKSAAPPASASSTQPAAPGPSVAPPNALAPPAAVPVPPAAAPPPSAQAPVTSPGEPPPPAAGHAAPPTAPAPRAAPAPLTSPEGASAGRQRSAAGHGPSASGAAPRAALD
jgi:serine/threonine-protein kinase